MSIKRGDLVMVVSGQFCCGGTGESTGRIFIATEGETTAIAKCVQCGLKEKITSIPKNSKQVYDVRRLRRIDPPAAGEYDGVPVRKQIPRKVTA